MSRPTPATRQELQKEIREADELSQLKDADALLSHLNQQDGGMVQKLRVALNRVVNHELHTALGHVVEHRGAIGISKALGPDSKEIIRAVRTRRRMEECVQSDKPPEEAVEDFVVAERVERLNRGNKSTGLRGRLRLITFLKGFQNHS